MVKDSTEKLVDKVYKKLLEKTDELKESLKIQLLEQMIDTPQSELIEQYIPYLSESIIKKALPLTESKDTKQIVESLKQSYTSGMIKEDKSFYESKLNEVSEIAQTISKENKELIAEVKTAYKKLDMQISAYDAMKAKTRAYELLECSSYKNAIRDKLLECTSVNEVEVMYKKLVNEEKSKDKIVSLNGMQDAQKYGLEGKGYSGPIKHMNESTYEQRKLAGTL